MSLEFPKRPVQKPHLIAEDIGPGIVRHRFSVMPFQLGFVVPGINMTQSPLEEDMNDATGTGTEAPGCGRLRCGLVDKTLLEEQIGEGNSSDSAGELAKEFSPG
jgi:hypothetical protein